MASRAWAFKRVRAKGAISHGVVAGLCCICRMWWAEALALSLLMLARCRIWLLCEPVGAVAAGALAAGVVDWSFERRREEM